MLEHGITLTRELANVETETVGVFPKGYVSILAGEPAVGKTWLMLGIAKGVIDGVNSVGLERERYRQGRVLLFAGETGVRLLAKRFFDLLPETTHIENLVVMSAHKLAMENVDVMLTTALGRKNIEAAIKEHKPEIVFFDTMISFTGDGKDESSQADMSDVIRQMSTVAQRYNTAVVMIHHFRKRSKIAKEDQPTVRQLDEVIGTSAFSRLAAVVVSIERNNDVRTVRCLKSWWKEFRPFSYRIETSKGHVELTVDYDYDQYGTHSVVPAVEKIQQQVLERYTSEGEQFTLQDVVLLTGYNMNKCSLALTALLSAKKIVSRGKSDGKARLYSVCVTEVSKDT